jgi:hypothetical protein
MKIGILGRIIAIIEQQKTAVAGEKRLHRLAAVPANRDILGGLKSVINICLAPRTQMGGQG